MVLDRLRSRLRSAPRPEAPAPSSAAAQAPTLLERADRLAGEGDPVAAVDLLAAANRERRDPDIEVRLVDLRRDAASAVRDVAPREPWPPAYPDRFAHLNGELPVASPAELDADLIGGAVAHHGALIVRGLFSLSQATAMAEAIDLAHDQRDAVTDGEAGSGPGAECFRPLSGTQDLKIGVLRNMVGRQGGIWLADSPRATALALDSLEDVGAVAFMTAHFGHRPFFSLQKSTLRRSEPEYRLVAWHQDGSFLNADVRTMNVWVALSPCGGDRPTPGLEVVPKRMSEMLPVDGVMSPHSIDYDLVASIAADTPTVIPEFDPGDALIFDNFFLHRTHLHDHMTEPRYALECWFFAPSHPASEYVPLLV